jgi:hypothetical protein
MMQKSERGFSLVELTMAAFLTVGITAAVFVLMRQNQRVFVSQYGVKDMNENVRVCMDLLTRDIQSAGAGLPRVQGNFASIYYNPGSSATTPDSLLMITGDLFAPYSGLVSVDNTDGSYYINLPLGINRPSGTGLPFTYNGDNSNQLPIFQAYSTSNPARYMAYDDTHASIFTLTAAGQDLSPQVRLAHDTSSDWNPASAFGCPVDTSAPNYTGQAYVALLGSTVAYRLNTATKELERTEDLNNWYAIGRGIVNFKTMFRIEKSTATDNTGATTNVVEAILSRPGVDMMPSTTVVTSRRDIRSVIITMEAETPDARPGDQNYRTETFKFEVMPRNLNLLNNNSLRYSVKVPIRVQPSQQ